LLTSVYPKIEIFPVAFASTPGHRGRRGKSLRNIYFYEHTGNHAGRQ
jgi:hypothetical protein